VTLQHLAELDHRYQVRFGLLNAIHFGAPQRRIRFFLFAAKRGIHLPEFPSPTHYSEDFKKPSKISFQVGHGERKWYCKSAVPESKGLAQSISLTVNEAISDLPYFDWYVLAFRTQAILSIA